MSNTQIAEVVRRIKILEYHGDASIISTWKSMTEAEILHEYSWVSDLNDDMISNLEEAK
tara:strand:- start:1452 stop:1628 length:177 start_codon:yes stop_codon:yes gene_type:complete